MSRSLVFALFAAARLAAQTQMVCLQKELRGDEAYSSPALEAALASSETSIASFIVHYETPYKDRIGAACRGALLVKPSQLRDLWSLAVEYGWGADPLRGRCGTMTSCTGLPFYSELPEIPEGNFERAPSNWQVNHALTVLIEQVRELNRSADRYKATAEELLPWRPANPIFARVRFRMLITTPRDASGVRTLVDLALSDPIAGWVVLRELSVDGNNHFGELAHAGLLEILTKTKDPRTALAAAQAIGKPWAIVRPLVTSSAVVAVAKWFLDDNLESNIRSELIRCILGMIDARPSDLSITRSNPAFARWLRAELPRFEKESAAERGQLAEWDRELGFVQ